MRPSQIMQQHTDKRSSWTSTTVAALVLLLAGNFGCVHWKHHLREHCIIGDLVQRHQGDYYHCSHCGKIIPGEGFGSCPHCAEVPSFHGYEPTCWRQFPQGWGCQPEHASQSELAQEGMLETEHEVEVIESVAPAADPVPETEIRSSGDVDADSASRPTLPALKDPTPFTVKASQKPAEKPSTPAKAQPAPIAAAKSTAPTKTKPAPAVTTAKAAKQPAARSSRPGAAKPNSDTVSKAASPSSEPNAAAVANKPGTQVDAEKPIAAKAAMPLSVKTLAAATKAAEPARKRAVITKPKTSVLAPDRQPTAGKTQPLVVPKTKRVPVVANTNQPSPTGPIQSADGPIASAKTSRAKSPKARQEKVAAEVPDYVRSQRAPAMPERASAAVRTSAPVGPIVRHKPASRLQKTPQATERRVVAERPASEQAVKADKPTSIAAQISASIGSQISAARKTTIAPRSMTKAPMVSRVPLPNKTRQLEQPPTVRKPTVPEPAAEPKLLVDTPKVANDMGAAKTSAAAAQSSQKRVAQPLRKILPRDEQGPIPIRKVKLIIDAEAEDQIYSLSDQHPRLERQNTPRPTVSSKPTVLKIPTPPADVEGKTYTFSDQHPKPVRRIPAKRPAVGWQSQPKVDDRKEADQYFPAPVRRIQLTRYQSNH